MAKTDINGDSRFYWMDLNPEDHFKDAMRTLISDELYGIVDAEAGIIAYAIGREHADEICAALGRDDG